MPLMTVNAVVGGFFLIMAEKLRIAIIFKGQRT